MKGDCIMISIYDDIDINWILNPKPCTIEDLKNPINLKMKKAILDCWDLLEPKPYHRCRSLSSRIPPLRDKEIIENQTNLLDDLRNIIESIANEIMKQED